MASGVATAVVGNATCTSTLGTDVDGTVSVRATDASGPTFTRTAPLQLTGSMTIPLDDLPGPKPDPLFPEQP